METPDCPVCAGSRHRDVWTHASGTAHGLCLDCGHAYLTRRRPLREILESYREYRQSYPGAYLLNRSNPLFALAERRKATLEGLAGRPLRSLLEVGCGYGHFLGLWEEVPVTVGIEPSRDQAAFARRSFRIGEVREAAFEDLEMETWDTAGEGFDAVASFHVLEHLADPARFAAFAHRVLREDGWLYLAVPDLYTLHPDLIELFFLCRNWHVQTFTAESLADLLRRGGFEVLTVEEEEPSAMLRSSVAVLARKTGGTAGGGPGPGDPERVERALRRFHGRLEAGLASVRCNLEDRWQRGKRIAVYGGGIHTRALLELAGVSPSWVCAVIDDDPAKAGTAVEGVPVSDFASALRRGIDGIVVSSLGSEDAILERLETRPDLEGIEIIGIYRDWMEGDPPYAEGGPVRSRKD